MSFRIGLAAFLLALAPASAQACMATGPDGYVSGLVWDNAPGELPSGAYVIQLKDYEPYGEGWAFTALVTDGPEAMIGRRYRFIAMNLNSCVGLGAPSGYAVVANEKVAFEVEGKEVTLLQLIDYKPTMMNEVVRVLFGGSQWRYPGKPSEKQVYPF